MVTLEPLVQVFEYDLDMLFIYNVMHSAELLVICDSMHGKMRRSSSEAFDWFLEKVRTDCAADAARGWSGLDRPGAGKKEWRGAG